MSLPLVVLPIAERWDCHQCGVCCRGSMVPLNDADLKRLEGQKWRERPEFRDTPVTATHPRGGSKLAQRADGRCVFLLDDGLCLIHKEHGFDEKPLVCRTFPLQVVPNDREAVLTIRRACPSAAADKGREASEWLADARRYVKESGLAEQPAAPPAFKSGEPAAWPRSRPVLAALNRLSTDDRYPPVRRLVHGIELCRLLEQADTRNFKEGKVDELVRVLEKHVADEAAHYFTDRQPPAAWAKTIFRQIGLEIVRLHPHFRAEPTWTTRFKALWWAIKAALGSGKLPDIHPDFPSGVFEQLEEPLGALATEMSRPLSRYFEAQAGSWEYALANRNGWSVVDSFRHLALLYPLSLWVLRWATLGSKPTSDAMFEIVTAIERAQGYDPLAGFQQRTRVGLLARDGEIGRLIAWYGR